MNIHFDNVTYHALLIPEPIWSENGLHKGRMLRILNNNDEPIGCIGVFFSLTTKAVWRNVTDTAITDDFIERIILTIIPRVHFPLNFTQVSTLYQSHRCLPVYVSSTDTGYNEERNTVYLFGENTPQDFIHKIVFKGHITDEKIQREVLDITYQQWQGKTTIPPTPIDISEALFLDDRTLHRNIEFLIQEEYLHFQKMQKYNRLTLQLTITHNGIKYAKRNYQDIEKAQYNITIMGDIAGRDLNKIHNTGDNTTNIINTGTQTIEDAFNELKEAITKEYTGTDKAAVLQEVDHSEKKQETIMTKKLL